MIKPRKGEHRTEVDITHTCGHVCSRTIAAYDSAMGTIEEQLRQKVLYFTSLPCVECRKAAKYG